MIPLKDNIPTSRFPIVTVILIALNVAAFAWQLTLPSDQASSSELERVGLNERDEATISYGAIPYRVTHPGGECSVISGPRFAEVSCAGAESESGEQAGETPLDLPPWWLTLLTAMFLHAGFLHLGFNMLFLWIFGNNIEDRLGRGRFLLFYLLAGLTATYAQALLDTGSTIPTIGASGAIAGVLGAYALLFPKAKVLSLVIIIFFVTLVEIPAMILLGLWLLLQFLPAIDQIATIDGGGEGGVAYLAHIGGFVFGLATIKLWVRRRDDSGSRLRLSS